MSLVGQLRTPATYPCYVRSWVTSGRGEEVVGTSVVSQQETFAGVKILLSEGPFLTQLGHSRGFESNGCLRPGTAVQGGLCQGPFADQKAVVRTAPLKPLDLTQTSLGGFRKLMAVL